MKIYFLFAALLFRQYTPKLNFNYPEVRRDENQIDNYNGTLVHDPYRWLEDLESEETKEFVISQNALTRPYLRQCPYRSDIRQSLTELMNYTRFGAMKKRGGRYFFKKSLGLENQMSLFVQDDLKSEPRLLMNGNALSPDGTTSLDDFFPSVNGKLLAYKLSKKGSDWMSMYFMNVDTAQIFDDEMADTKFTRMEWSHDNNGIFYSKYSTMKKESDNSTETSKQLLYYHILGTNQDSDILVVEFSENPKWSCVGEVSYDGKWLIVYFEDELGPVQIHYMNLEEFLKNLQPKPKLIPIVDNFLAEYYYVTNENKIFYFVTNKDAPNWKIVGINFDNPQDLFWDVIVPEDPKFVLEWVAPVNKDKLVLSYLQDVKSSLQIRSLDGKTLHATYPMDAGSSWTLYRERNDTEFFFGFESILIPKRVYHFDFTEHSNSPSLQLFREALVPGFNSTDYILTQKFFQSKDGTKIPIFVAHKKDLILGEDTPCLLYGYGGFNSVTLPYFSSDQAMFLKHFNGVYAIANIRGGGEYGLKWYNGGRLLNKQNTFDDFQAAAEFLIKNNYTSSGKLTIHGTSNGGLLVAACVNQRPDLYGAALAQVGVMDVTRFNKFPAGESWTSDYGNPENMTQFQYLLNYSPLQNVHFPEGDNVTQYPATLLFTADHDDRVVPSHSYKLIAEMQYTLGRTKRQKNPLFLLVQADAGHGGGKPTSKWIDEYTDMYSFVCKALSLKFEK